MLTKAINRLLTRAAQNRDCVFACVYRAATVRESVPKGFFQQLANLNRLERSPHILFCGFIDARYFLTLNRGSILAFGDFRFSTRFRRYRSAAHAAGMRRSVDGGGGVPHSWYSCAGTLCLFRFVDTCQPCDAQRIPDENRRSGRGRAGSVASCAGRRECGSPHAVGDIRGGLGFDGTRRVVARRAAFRVAADPNSEAAAVTALPRKILPFPLLGDCCELTPSQNRDESEIADA